MREQNRRNARQPADAHRNARQPADAHRRVL